MSAPPTTPPSSRIPSLTPDTHLPLPFLPVRPQRLKPNAEKKTSVPTVGFNMEAFEKGSLRFNVFDMSGANKYRSLWEKYYKDAEAVVFVVDTSDKFRMCVVKVRPSAPTRRGSQTLLLC